MAITACAKSVVSDTKTQVKSSTTSSWVEEKLSTLTLEDKVGEMTQLSVDVLAEGQPYNLVEPFTFNEEKLKKVLVDLRVGSILNCGGHAYTRDEWKHIITTVQKYADMKESKIPVLYGIDAIHGTNYTIGSTLFPQALATASTWDPEFSRQCAAVTGYETKASGIPWSFSPVLDVGRDARWPRLWETYGEDVLLVNEMGVAYVEGIQGDDISASDKVACTMKHFLGYSIPSRGKDRMPAYVHDRQLKEYIVPPFQAAVDAGANSVMICSGEMNGIPVHVDEKILKTLLRDELGFEGVAVTDWEDIGYLYQRHRVAVDFKDAIGQAVNAGIDMAMVPMDTTFPSLLIELVNEGVVPMSRIDEAVGRVLQMKKDLGLFETPVPDFDAYPKFASDEFIKMSYEAAKESMVLLENRNNVLPLDGSKLGNILVTGPNANTLTCLNGGWSRTWQGVDTQWDTPGKWSILDAIKAEQGAAKVTHTDGTDIKATVAAAASADAIVVVLGETPYTEKPGDIDDLNLFPEQRDLVKALKDSGKPMVLIMIEGRPRLINDIVDIPDAIMVGFLPGEESAKAISDLLFGKANPSGKLPITYPKFANDLVTYDHKGTDLAHRDFSMNGFNPQWEFGHGLSYTTFEYSNLRMSQESIPMNGSITIQVDVKNTGAREGKEVVQLYINDKVASITPSVKKLRGFDKVSIAPGAMKTVSFTITTDELAFVGRDNEWITEAGEFEVVVGSQTGMFKVQ